MTEQITALGNAVIGDLEMTNMKIGDDLEATKNELAEMKKGDSYWWKKWDAAQSAVQGWMNRWRDAEDRVISLERTLDASRKENQQLASLWRDHLDEGDPEDDNEWESQARQILCDASDIEKQMEAAGDYVPF